MDVLLATPQPRTRLLLEKVGALLIALLLIAVLFALGVVGGRSRSWRARRFCQGIVGGAESEPVGLLLWHGGAAHLAIDDQPLPRQQAGQAVC